MRSFALETLVLIYLSDSGSIDYFDDELVYEGVLGGQEAKCRI